MYKSPIEMLVADIQHQIEQQQDEEIYKAVVSVGINVDKNELIQALQYDRQQYDKGYADGHRDAMESIVGEGNTWGDGFKQGYEDGFKVGFNADKWIPVTERLPERFGSFAVVVKELGGKMYSDFADYDPYEKWWRTSLVRGIEDVVTHWMPLPQPPKGE